MDDLCWILRNESANLWATTILATYLALGVPLSWKKTVLSEVNTWLGFVVNPRTLVVRMPQDKHDIIMEILKKLSQGENFTSKAIEKALGRINWATSVCPLSRPFLEPFWAWKTACKSSGKPPKLVCLFAKMLTHIFSVPYHQPSPYLGTSPWWGASDASATKDMATGYPMIGGWISDLEFPTRKQYGGSNLPSHQKTAPGLLWRKTPLVELQPLRCWARSCWRLASSNRGTLRFFDYSLPSCLTTRATSTLS